MATCKSFLVTKVKTVDRLELLISKIEKYTQHFKERKETLSFLMDQHKFPYTHVCDELFFPHAYDSLVIIKQVMWQLSYHKATNTDPINLSTYDGNHATTESPNDPDFMSSSK
jgi:hypothetical protein